MSTTPTLRLRITPVPRPLFGLNLRKTIGKGRWRKIRKALLEENGHVCAICGARPEEVRQIHGHEEWAYDTSTSPAVARLNGITLHCWLCHGVEHYLLAMKLAALGYEEQERLIVQHFCEVNGIDEDAFAAHLSEAMAAWSPLCDLEWTVDYGDYAPLIAIRVAAQEKWKAAPSYGADHPAVILSQSMRRDGLSLRKISDELFKLGHVSLSGKKIESAQVRRFCLTERDR